MGKGASKSVTGVVIMVWEVTHIWRQSDGIASSFIPDNFIYRGGESTIKSTSETNAEKTVHLFLEE